MKNLLLTLSFAFVSLIGYSQTTNPKTEHIHGYIKSNGTYVEPHYQTKPNKTTKDNWSTKGNTNFETEKSGTKSPTYNNTNNHIIQTGPKDGHSYINSNGNKTYVPK